MKNPEFHTYKIVDINSLIPYVTNARTHEQWQIAQIRGSIKEFGFTNPVLIEPDGSIIAGHGRVLAALDLGFEELPAIEIKGLTKAKKAKLVIADNQFALNAGWDLGILKSELEFIQEAGEDIGELGFDDKFLNDLFERGDDDSSYTKKIDAPLYEPTGEKPDIIKVYNTEKTDQLLSEIKGSDLPDGVRDFLIAAAYRHTKFNYEQIAEFYAQSNADIQELMESSALVIIDFDRAIADGYVRLNDAVTELYQRENGEADE